MECENYFLTYFIYSNFFSHITNYLILCNPFKKNVKPTNSLSSWSNTL